MVQKQPLKPNRQRFLNIIYFIDSNKTKTFKFNLNLSYIALGMLITTVLWSFISTILLFNAYDTSELQSQRVRSLLATIFNYQTRYDRVYERTYPNDGSIPKPLPELSDYERESESEDLEKTSEKIVTNESQTLAAKVAVPAPKVVEQTPPPQAVKVQEVSKPIAKAISPTTEKTKNEIVKLDKYKVSQVKNNLALDFAIKNLIRPNKANGYVIGFAKFIGIDGTTTTVSSPTGLIEDQKINKWKLPRNHRFSIRYYTQKTLLFDVPDKRGGTFESIKIIVGGKNNEPIEFVYTIKGSEGAFAPTLETAPNIENENSSENNGNTSP